MFTGDRADARNEAELDLYRLPINVFWNGNLAVCIFFVLSGFVLSYKFLKSRDQEILYSSAFRRYPRLLIPVAGSIFIGFIFVKFGFIYNRHNVELTNMPVFIQNYWAVPGDFISAINQSVWRVYTRDISSPFHFNPVLWTMYFEFIGSFIVFGVLALFKMDRARYYAYAFLAVALWNSYLLAFIIGMVLCDLYNSQLREKIIQSTVMGSAALVMGFILGTVAYPSPDANHWTSIHFNQISVQTFHVIGAGLLVYSVIALGWLQKLFGLRPLVYLGRMSFSIYLIHSFIIVGFSRRMFYKIAEENWLSYLNNFLLTCAVSLVLIFAASWVYMRLVDEKAIELSKKWYLAMKEKSNSSPQELA